MLDLNKFVAGVHEYCRKAIAPLALRIKALEDRPPEKGEKGDRGEKGIPGDPGQDGIDGIDGSSVSIEQIQPIIEAAIARGLLDLERRASDLIQRAIERIEKPKDGSPGKDGRDAFALDSFGARMLEDGRTLRLSLGAGEQQIASDVRMGFPLYRGIWKAGDYIEGDTVTFGGSCFIALRDTSSKPETDDSWRLAVKRGRDGKDGEKGAKGERGEAARHSLGAFPETGMR